MLAAAVVASLGAPATPESLRLASPADTVRDVSGLVRASDALEHDWRQQVDELFSSFTCKHVYLDVGTNLGVQIRKLYEPHKYPKAEGIHAFDEDFARFNRCNVCSIGFEPNPAHSHRLTELQTRMRRDLQVGVIIFQAAVGTDVSKMTFEVDESSDHEDVGASGRQGAQSGTGDPSEKLRPVSVPTLDLAPIVLRVQQLMQQQAEQRNDKVGKIMMKMDIEGSEFSVLPHLVRSQALCMIGRVQIEWHERFYTREVGNAAARTLKLPWEESGSTLAEEITVKDKDWFMSHMAQPSDSCQTWLEDVDDESYIHDGAPWPSAKCGEMPTEQEVAQMKPWLEWVDRCSSYGFLHSVQWKAGDPHEMCAGYTPPRPQ